MRRVVVEGHTMHARALRRAPHIVRSTQDWERDAHASYATRPDLRLGTRPCINSEKRDRSVSALSASPPWHLPFPSPSHPSNRALYPRAQTVEFHSVNGSLCEYMWYIKLRYKLVRKIGRLRGSRTRGCANAAPAAMPPPTEAREGCSGLMGDACAHQLDGSGSADEIQSLATQCEGRRRDTIGILGLS